MDALEVRLRGAPPRQAFAWAAERVGPRARVDAWMRLPGGSACASHALDVLDGRGVRHPLVLKRFLREDWLAREPDVAAREARHLEALVEVALPIPRLVGVDPDGSDCDAPAVLMTRLPGRVELVPSDLDAWLRCLAMPLVVLHGLPDAVASSFAPYRSYNVIQALEPPVWTRHPGLWSRALDHLRGETPLAPPRFVHRDYHPSNLLFERGRVSGVLDFNDSSYGPAAADLGHCRMNLVQLHGVEVADRFLESYRELSPGALGHDPYWDLMSLVEVLPGPDELYPGWPAPAAQGLSLERVRRRLDAYLASLVARLDD